MKQADKAQSVKTDYVSSFAERAFRYSANLTNRSCSAGYNSAALSNSLFIICRPLSSSILKAFYIPGTGVGFHDYSVSPHIKFPLSIQRGPDSH